MTDYKVTECEVGSGWNWLKIASSDGALVLTVLHRFSCAV